jgi:hypothetical protein
MTTDLQKHLESIQIASSELLAMQKRTAHPALVQHQYIGTVLDNTISLLTAPANSLDRGHRYLTFTDPKNWLSLMQAVHRSFLSSIHTATEKGLVDYCNTRGAVVESRIRSDAVVHLNELAKLVGDEHRALKKLHRLIGKGHPSFDDYLNSALEVSCFTTKQKTVWRRFFKALSTVRNKVSHSDTTLSDAEQEALKTGGLGAMVSSKGELMVNPQMYHQLATFLLDFFDSLLNSKKPI